MYKNRLSNMPSSQYGDPFIMRHDGYYYLYTTPANRVLQVQRSEDLINWEMLGTISNDATLDHAYAPEVKYFNGKFYLVASPSGKGHYIYSSASPEGPFVAETGNFEMNIDGSFFVDDDGSWYFYNAAWESIEGRQMSSPTTVDGRKNLLGPSLLHWTEGPFVIKRNGIYYLTYTGSHYLSEGYRVSYATSTKGPLGPWEISKDNPIVLNTEKGFSNLGHSISVLGPDLDSWYIVYHDMNMGVRGMNIDRLSFNGKRMYVSGPTNFSQPAPNLPIYSTRGIADMDKKSWKDNEIYLSKKQSTNTFTAEYNLTDGLGAAIVFGYRDENNFWYAQWSSDTEFKIVEVNNGVESNKGSFSLPMSFDPCVLHNLRLASDGSRIEIYFDGMLRYEGKLNIPAGYIGYMSSKTIKVGFTALSDVAFGSSDKQTVYNLPSGFAAANHVPQEQNGASDGIRYRDDDTSKSVLLSKGEYISFKVNAGGTGLYHISLECADEGTEDFEIEVFEDGKKVGSFRSSKLHYAESGTNGWKFIPLGTVTLNEGIHTLSFRLKNGKMDCRTIKVAKTDALKEKQTFSLTEKNEQIKVITSTNGVRYNEQGMRAIGTDTKVMTNTGWYTDFSAKVTVSGLNNVGKGETGLVIRMSNPSSHDHQMRAAYVGYIAAVNGRNITLKHNRYENQRTLGSYRLPEAADEIELEIRAVGALITVCVNGEAVIEAVDPYPITSGGAGLVFTSEEKPVGTVFKDLVIAPVK